MVLVTSEFTNDIMSRQSALRPPSSQSAQVRTAVQEAIQEASEAMLETTRLQWAQPLHKTTERSVEERLLDAA
jgi:hypothetical protein